MLVKVAKNRWKNLRAYFIAQLRELDKPKSGSGGCVKTTSSWAFYNQLLFLKDVSMSADNTRDDSLTPTKASEFSDQTQVNETNDSDLDNFLDSPAPEVGTEKNISDIRRANTNKRKRSKGSARFTENTENEILHIEKRKVELLEREINAEQNPDLLFFQSLLPYMREFTPTQKLRIRSKIQNLILAEHEATQQGSATEMASNHQSPYYRPSSASSMSADSAQYHTSSTTSPTPQPMYTNLTSQNFCDP